MIGSLRARLTVWYISVLAVVLVVVSLLIHELLRRQLLERIDQNLRAVTSIAITSLDNDLAEGQGVVGAARSTSAELHSNQAMVAIYDGAGTLLAEAGRDDELQLSLPLRELLDGGTPVLFTATESDDDDRHRIAVRRAVVGPSKTEFLIAVGSDLEPAEAELAALRSILASVVPIALVIAAIVGWFLARHSLSPVIVMADKARRIGIENLGGRLPVVNPHDELGRLAATFNELLGRLEASFAQQRQFMADASHELRTPVATTRTAVTVALQVPHRGEKDYRDTLEIIEHQTDRLARLVDDMFTLARADAGNYPVQRSPMYLDELVDEVARATRVLADSKQVAVDVTVEENAAFTGDEELIRRMLVNLLDNAIRHAPKGSAVVVSLRRVDAEYQITVSDRGRGIPLEARPYIFERFYRSETARGRAPADMSGAGLGLSIARWIARLHDGDISLVSTVRDGTTFLIRLRTSEPVPEAPVVTV